eukprot:COSAG01_NODE_6154_length_3821_cov_1.639441_5_plen_61_part_00
MILSPAINRQSFSINAYYYFFFLIECAGQNLFLHRRFSCNPLSDLSGPDYKWKSIIIALS